MPIQADCILPLKLHKPKMKSAKEEAVDFRLSRHRLKTAIIEWLGVALLFIAALKILVEELHSILR